MTLYLQLGVLSCGHHIGHPQDISGPCYPQVKDATETRNAWLKEKLKTRHIQLNFKLLTEYTLKTDNIGSKCANSLKGNFLFK
jgi:hypothetical protein